jgi:hypothetical protein
MLASTPVSTNVIDQESMSVGQHGQVLAALAEDEVVAQRLLVLEEVLLDVVGLVPEAQDEVLVPVVGVVLHQVPHDRAVPDRDHRLGDVLENSRSRSP